MDGATIVDGPAANNLQGNIQYNAATGAHEGNIDGTANGWYQLENVFREVPAQPYQDIMTALLRNIGPNHRLDLHALEQRLTATNGNGNTTTHGYHRNALRSAVGGQSHQFPVPGAGPDR